MDWVQTDQQASSQAVLSQEESFSALIFLNIKERKKEKGDYWERPRKCNHIQCFAKERAVGGEEKHKKYTLKKEEEEEGCFSFVPDFLEAEINYTVKVKAVNQSKESRLSGVKKQNFSHRDFQKSVFGKSAPMVLVKKERFILMKTIQES